jgi:hypothetical protein
MDPGALSRVVNGRRAASPDLGKRCDVIFGTGNLFVGLAENESALDGTTTLAPIPSWGEWIDGFAQAEEEWELDVERRKFLQKSAYVAAASTTPALQWLTGTQGEDSAKLTGRFPVGRPHVENIREMNKAFRALDNRFGGANVRESVAHFLRKDVAPLVRDGRYDSRLGANLLGATAETMQILGWMTFDAGLHGLGQRYMTRALRLAGASGDKALGVEILLGLSHQASYLRDASTAVDLARAAMVTARGNGLDVLAAEAALMEAHGYACARDEARCVAALRTAETTLERADRSSDPHWIGYFGVAYLSAKFGHCFKELRRTDLARRYAQSSLEMDDTYVRGKTFNLALLATVEAQAGEVEASVSVGLKALDLAQSLNSQRVKDYMRVLNVELQSFDSPHVSEFQHAYRSGTLDTGV